MPASNPVTEILQPQAKSPDHQGIIRERVSINGVIRPLEAEQSLPGLQVMPELVGTISEHWVYRYIAGTEHNEKKYAGRIKHVAKRRERSIAKLQQGSQSHTSEGDVSASSEWSLAWALEVDERPPPSSLVARRDIVEALTLARGAKRRRVDVVLYEKEQRVTTKGESRVGAIWKRHGSSPQAAVA